MAASVAQNITKRETEREEGGRERERVGVEEKERKCIRGKTRWKRMWRNGAGADW